MRSRRPAEAFTVKSSGGSQQRSMWQSAEIISYRIARERSSAELARQAPRKRRAGDAGAAGILPLARARVASPATQLLLARSEEHTSELQSRLHLVCRLLLEKKINHSMTVPSAASASLISLGIVLDYFLTSLHEAP